MPAIEEESDGNQLTENVNELPFLEPRTLTVSERVKVKFTRAVGNALEGLSKVPSSLRSGVSSLKKPKAILEQKSEEVVTEGSEALSSELHVKDMARKESSGRRIAEHARRFGSSVATGVARGTRAVGGLLSKALDRVRDRSADAEGFERI